MRSLIRFCAALLISLSAAPLHAQSLGEVAKREEERRKETKAAPKTYTNRDLPEPPSPPAAATPAPDTPDAPPAAAPAAAARTMNADDPDGRDDAVRVPEAEKAPAATKPAAVARDGERQADRPADDTRARDQWQQRMRALREQLERNRILTEALQTRMNSLDNDFVGRDDPAQRAQLANERSRTAAELTRLKKAVAADEKAIPALEEEARRAGVPPGWLR